jgi:penicillin-binding protein 1B
MKKAVALPQYTDVKSFDQPAGVVDVQLDKLTNRLATPSCPDDYSAAFIVGTEPNATCDQAASAGGFFSRMFGLGSQKALPPPGSPASTAESDDAQRKKGFFGKIVGIFKTDKPSNPPAKPPDGAGNPP